MTLVNLNQLKVKTLSQHKKTQVKGGNADIIIIPDEDVM